LRTNPKLTTNIRIVADSKDRVFLESIDADPLLSKSIYKGFEVTGGTYARDIYRFYSQGTSLLPSSIAYLLKEKDESTEIQDRYKNQYDFDLYCMGTEPKISRLYTEEYSMFFPLWIEPECIPDYFVIFKMDGPATVNSKEFLEANPSENLDDSTILKSLVESPEEFFNNYIKYARVIKTFDLTENSSIGKYIRNHAKDELFPESSIYASLQKGELSYWHGMSYQSGGFVKTSQDIYADYVLVDKTITEKDDFITTNFQRLGIVHPNILNLEFLFDDPEAGEYKFSRYYGMYVSETQMGKFEIDGNRLYNDKDVEFTQLPTPKKNVIGYNTNVSNQYQENDRGVKVYPLLGGTGGTSIYAGRLLTFSETQNPRYPYIKDAEGNFYSITQSVDWSSTYSNGPTSTYTDSNFLRVKNTKLNWRTFTGFDKPFKYINALATDLKGRPNLTFDVIDTVSSGDQIRISYTDWNDPNQQALIDFYTIFADSNLPPGKNSGLLFSCLGTPTQVASAIASSINFIQEATTEHQVFTAVSVGPKVIVFSRLLSENWNKIKYTIFSQSVDFPFSLPNEFVKPVDNAVYQPSPVSLAPISVGWLYSYNFTGGCDNPKSRYIIEKENVKEFVDDIDPVYVQSTKGFVLPGKYTVYLDEPILDKNRNIIGFNDVNKYVVYQLEDESADVIFTSSKSVALYNTRKNYCGYFTLFPIRDFDFDFFDTTYSKDSDSRIEGMFDFYTGNVLSGIANMWNYFGLTATSQQLVDSMCGVTSSFVINKKFQKLGGISNDFLDENPEVFNEYDRLKENLIPEIALSSRVVPFINKWVYDNECTDVRENPYRLNTDQSFGYANFSPSFDEISRNPKFFTHEWYYLQKYPPYMSFGEKVKSFSYFDEDLYFPDLPALGASGSTATYFGLTGGTGATANLLSINEDYFTSYFTRESVDGTPIPRDFKYTIFGYGTEQNFSETLFRGAKVIVKERSEYSPINYNVESLRYLANPKYNGYKFSVVLTYGQAGTQITCIKNDKWKAITVVIQGNLVDPIWLQYKDTTVVPNKTVKFIDRSLLYALNHKVNLNINPGPNNNTFTYADVNLSGEIYGWGVTPNSPYRFIVYGRTSLLNGTSPSFDTEISVTESGGYDMVVTKYAPANLELQFQGISNVTANSFECTDIVGVGIPSLSASPGNECLVDVNYMMSPIPSGWPFSSFDPFTWPRTVCGVPTYKNGGWNAYNAITDQLSFASISNSINSGEPEVRYISVSEKGEIAFNQWCLEVSRPDYPVKSTYLKPAKTKEAPIDLLNSSTTIGYEISTQDRIDIHQISRYRGPYNPKWKNAIQFFDSLDIKSDKDIDGNSLEYNNIQLFSYVPNANPSKVQKDEKMFIIPNLYYNKVNVESPNVILRYVESRRKSIFPLVGEIAIDKKDYSLFKSNWDPYYFDKYLRANVKVPQIGTREPKEKKSFFGSKTISIPNSITIQTFPSGVISKSEIGQLSKIKSVPQNIVNEEIVKNGNRYLNLRVYGSLALSDWLIADGISDEFYKWISPDYSFGNPDQEDDVRTYISENIFQRYIIKEVILWEKFWKKGNPLPDIQTGLTDSQKIAAGYVRSKSFQTTFEFPDSLDFQLIYNIPKDRNYSIAFTLVLEKK
jgi:hypothetical protein